MSRALNLLLYRTPNKAGGRGTPPAPDEYPFTDNDIAFAWSHRSLTESVGQKVNRLYDWSGNNRHAEAASASWNPLLTSDHRATVVDVGGGKKAIQFTGPATVTTGPNLGQGYVLQSLPMGSPQTIVYIFRSQHSSNTVSAIIEQAGFSVSPANPQSGGYLVHGDLRGGTRTNIDGNSGDVFFHHYSEISPAGEWNLGVLKDNGVDDYEFYDLAESVSPLTPTFNFGTYQNPTVAYEPHTATIGFRSHPTNNVYLYLRGELLELWVFSGQKDLTEIITYMQTYHNDLLFDLLQTQDNQNLLTQGGEILAPQG